MFREFEFLSADGKTGIHVREYVPQEEIKGVVQIAHGVAEHSERYDEFMRFLAENGYAVAANDHLGHGKSVAGEEKRGFFTEEDGWKTVVRDIKRLHDLQKEKYPGKFTVLFGHSMGSFLSRTYVIDHPDDFDAAIFCGTGQPGSLLTKIGSALAERECRKNGPDSHSEKLQNVAFGGYNKAFQPVRTEYDWLSRREENVDAYMADPFCGGVSSAGLFRDMMAGIRYLSDKKNIAKMKKSMPIFLISGSMDPVGDYGKGVQKAFLNYQKAGLTNVCMHLYPDDRHEILNEANRKEVFADILQWIEEQNS